MENFIRIINIILPVFIVMGFGFLGRKKNILSEDFLKISGKLVFHVFLPINLFMNIYNAEGIGKIDYRILIYGIIGLVFITIISYFIYRFMGFPLEERSVMVQALSRSNIILFGLAIAGNYFERDALALISIYIGMISAFSNGFSVVIYEILLGDSIHLIKIMKSVFKNAIFIAAIAGILMNFSGMELPLPVQIAGRDLAAAALPLGLICIGGTLHFHSGEEEKRALWTAVISKAVIVPLIMLSLFVSSGIRGPELFVMIIVFAAPVAVSTHAISMIYTSKYELSGKIIVYTTLLNSLTIFVSLYILSSIGFV